MKASILNLIESSYGAEAPRGYKLNSWHLHDEIVDRLHFNRPSAVDSHWCSVRYQVIELELELIQTQMTQKPMLRAEVGMRVRCANKASAE